MLIALRMSIPVERAELVEPYFLGLGRAMASLGPLRSGTFCRFRCRFCYVYEPYPRYASRSVKEIID